MAMLNKQMVWFVKTACDSWWRHNGISGIIHLTHPKCAGPLWIVTPKHHKAPKYAKYAKIVSVLGRAPLCWAQRASKNSKIRSPEGLWIRPGLHLLAVARKSGWANDEWWALLDECSSRELKQPGLDIHGFCFFCRHWFPRMFRINYISPF